MASKNRKSSQSLLRKTVFCPECGTMMRYVKTKPHQHVRDDSGALVNVSRVFYGCSSCHTIINFFYREDGKEGDLHKLLQFCKDAGIKPGSGGGVYL